MYTFKKDPKVSRPVLLKDLNKSGSPTITARRFGVSRVCIHYWMKYYGIKGKRTTIYV